MLNTKGRVSPLGITVDKFQRKTTVKIILRKELESSKPEFFVFKFFSHSTHKNRQIGLKSKILP